jgi:hypothetical protein
MLSEGSTEEVAVSAATAEFRDKIITKVEDGILKIYYESKLGAVNKKEANKRLRAYVSYKKLDKLAVTTGAGVEINGVLRSGSLDLKVNTGAVVNGQIDISSLKVDQNTGSRVTLTGTAGKLEIEGGTGSKFAGEGLKTSNCDASVGTGAVISITVDKELTAKANTGGRIRYKGQASARNIKTSTGGAVSKI